MRSLGNEVSREKNSRKKFLGQKILERKFSEKKYYQTPPLRVRSVNKRLPSNKRPHF